MHACNQQGKADSVVVGFSFNNARAGDCNTVIVCFGAKNGLI